MLTWESSASTVWVIMKLRVHTTCQNWLACQSVSGIHCFCQKKDSCLWVYWFSFQNKVSLVIITSRIGRTEASHLWTSQFWQMINNLRWHVSRDETSGEYEFKVKMKFLFMFEWIQPIVFTIFLSCTHKNNF